MCGRIGKGFSTGKYPAALRLHVAEEVHGVPLRDPYHWLGDIESQEGLAVLDWWAPSTDGKLLAYELSWQGDE